jgi:hypothetical protein
MSQQPHDKTGRKCSFCQVVFSKSSLTFTIAKKEGNMIVHLLACPKCHHNYYSKGE